MTANPEPAPLAGPAAAGSGSPTSLLGTGASTRRGDDRPPDRDVARAELVLAADPTLALARLELDPDPIDALAAALTGLQGQTETVELHLDLLPMTPARQHQLRAAALRDDTETAAGPRGGARMGVGEQLRLVYHGATKPAPRPATGGRSTPTPLVRSATLRRTRGVADKILAVDEPWWELQLLLRVTSTRRGRAEPRLHAVLAALQQFAAENHLRVAGQRLGGFYLGSDLPWRRRRFDRRADTGLFRPTEAGWVTTREVAGLFKPPSKRCGATNVARSGGPVPPPPRELPTYRGVVDRDLLPQGWVRDERGWRPTGSRKVDTFFEALTGGSRSGKTERMVAQFLHLALTGEGGMYLDPHVQAIERMKPYLGACADRICEFNLARTGARRQAGYNLLSMTGRSRADIDGRISAVVTSFSAALSWGAINNRAQNLVTQSVWSLCEIGLALPPELQPTIFQITTLLSDELWRAAVLPHLPPEVAAFWTTRFGNLEKGAITPITNLLDRLRSSPVVAALLGSPQSTFDPRHAMDHGQLVLASPAGTGDKDVFLASFFLYDMFLAALSRQDSGLAPEQLRWFWLACDEMQELDRAGTVLERMLRETGKYGLRILGATQSLSVLNKNTQDMWLTNRSHLISSVERSDAAKTLAKEWSDKVAAATITRLERFTAIGQITHHGKRTNPYWMRGFDVADLFAEHYDETAPADITRATAANLGYRPVDQTLAELATLDARIATWLASHPPRTRTDVTHRPDPTPPPAAPTHRAPTATTAGGPERDQVTQDSADEAPQPTDPPDGPSGRGDMPANVTPLRRPTRWK